MATYHKVLQGECLSSISSRYGFSDYRAIYDHPKNAHLKRKRPNPNILLPGDCLYIPDKQEKRETRSTAQEHRFQIAMPTVLLRLFLRYEDEKPCADCRYTLKIDNVIHTGRTRNDGLLEQQIPAGASQAEVMLWLEEGNEEDTIRIPLAVGHLDPVEEVSGVQARLNNLGFSCGSVDGVAGAMTEQAIRRFQSAVGLPVTGRMDAQTLNRLRQRHDGA